MDFKKTKTGFTLIEVIIVIAIIGIILPTLFGTIFTLLRLQIQTSQLQRLKEVGDFVSNNMINTVRNYALSVDNSCGRELIFVPVLQGVDHSVMFRDKYDNCFGYYVKDAQLASISAVLNPTEYTTYLVTNDQTDYGIRVKTDNILLSRINNKLAKVKFTLETVPKVAYLPSQQLSYQFFIYIRN